MSDPTKAAACPLYFSAHGGQFDRRGNPIFNGIPIPAVCDRAFDCGTCSLMTQWVSSMVASGWVVGWECDKCLKETFLEDKGGGRGRIVPGFYHSGRRDDPDNGGLTGCTRCGWESSFIQIILRRPHG